MTQNKISFLPVFLSSCILVFLLSGCATVPKPGALPTYGLNGTTYVPLLGFCAERSIRWDYDTFTQIVNLKRGVHEVNLRIGDTSVIIDGQLQQLRHPVEMHEGQVVIPLKLKDQISGLFVQSSSSAPLAKALLPQISIKKVVIDPGHGGKDPGAIGRTGLREKDVNLDIAYRLAKLLRDDGVAVVMTRSTDTFISLERRVEIANNSGADLFISVHANASRTRSLNGFEAYYVSTKSSDVNRAAAAADKARPNLDGGAFAYTTKPLMATLWDMLLTFNRGESIQLARQICKTIGKDLETKILGVKGANFYVLKGARMPAVLLEAGFLSHAQEERMLKNSYYRQQIAESIERGIIRYAQDYTVMLTYN